MITGLLMSVHVLVFPFAGAGVLALHINAATVIDVGKPFTVSFTVTNTGQQGVYFKRPWKWATNGLFLEARDSGGHVYTSVPVLSDIAADARCTFFKPLGPRDSFTFSEVVGPVGHSPGLDLPRPGRYRLKWVYDVKHYDDEAACASGGWPVWQGRAESPELEVVVR